jgi:CubicO group peptidase (beta-lactamase class C family)
MRSFLLCFLCWPLYAHPLEEPVRKILDEQRAAYGTPGMTAAVIDRGQVFVVASGLRDREANLPMTPDTQVPAASISKLFTAALVMRQVELGRLSLDVPVNSYVPERFWIRDASGNPAGSTLRQLLSHSSGLPVSWAGIALKGQTPLSLNANLGRGQTIRHAPGSRIVYANDGFALAGFVAAKAANEEFLGHASQLLHLLSMQNSTWESPWTFKGPNFSAAYGGLTGGSDRGYHNDVTGTLPAGGLISTAPDLTHFALMLLDEGVYQNQRILSKKSIEEMWTIQARQHPAMQSGFGLGFGIRQYRGHKIVWWDGGLAGAANRLTLVPSRRSAVIVLSNMSENSASAIAANRILDLILPAVSEPAYVPAQEDLASYAGRYRFYDSLDRSFWFLRYAMDIRFEVRNGTLHHESRLTKSGSLIPVERGRFRIQGSMMDDSEIYFDGDHVYIGYLNAKRVPALASPAALVIYIVCGLLLAASGFFILFRAVWRRIRTARGLPR